MPAGVADAADLVEVGLRTVTEPIHKRLECLRMGSILRLEFAQLRLRAPQDELRERRGCHAQARAKWFERSRKCRRLRDRMSGMGRRHRTSVAPYSTGSLRTGRALGYRRDVISAER